MKSVDILRLRFEEMNELWKFVKKYADCKDKPDAFWDKVLGEARTFPNKYTDTPLHEIAHNDAVQALHVLQEIMKGE